MPLDREGGYVTPMRARALEFCAPYEVRLVDATLPEPRAGEILVRTRYSGISSGTELLAYRGQVDPRLPLDETIGSLGGTFAYPFRYGYSCVGVVERSEHELPAGAVVFAYYPHQDRFVCRAEDVLVMLEGTDARLATLFPLVETALQIRIDSGDLFAETVVVMGLGCVGILTSLLLQATGARVLAVEPTAERRSLAQDLDVDSVAPLDASSRVAELTDGGGACLVVEVSGNPDALATALPLLAHEGTALVASWYGTKLAPLALGAEFHRRRLSIRSSQVSTIPARLAARWSVTRRRHEAMNLMSTLPLKRLATHEFDFDRAPDAFAALDRGDAALVHAAFSYHRS